MERSRRYRQALTAVVRPAGTACALTILFIGGGAALAAAQTPAASFADLGERLHAGQTVYLRTAEVTESDGRGIKGKLTSLSGSTLTLVVKGKPRQFSESDVLVVSEHHTSAGTGALTGLLVGAGFGLTATRHIGSDPESQAWRPILTGISAVFGAGVGTRIGRAIKHDRVLYAATPPRPKAAAFSVAPIAGVPGVGLRASVEF